MWMWTIATSAILVTTLFQPANQLFSNVQIWTLLKCPTSRSVFSSYASTPTSSHSNIPLLNVRDSGAAAAMFIWLAPIHLACVPTNIGRSYYYYHLCYDFTTDDEGLEKLKSVTYNIYLIFVKITWIVKIAESFVCLAMYPWYLCTLDTYAFFLCYKNVILWYPQSYSQMIN